MAEPTSPDYYTSLAKQLQPSKPFPVNKGPYLDQAGQMPIQAVMSPEDFQGSLGPNWAEFSKPGGYLDKTYQNQAQIRNPSGDIMTIKAIEDALAGAGRSFTPNPFLALPTLQGQLYTNLDKNVGNFYGQLQDALNAGRQDFQQRSAGFGDALTGYFDQAGRDVAGFGRDRMASNQDFANSIGLGQTTGSGSQSSNLADQLARLGAINSTNKANAQATFAQRRGIIDDLLAQRSLAAATSGAQTRSAIAQMAGEHWGLQDPNQLYQDYLTNKNQVDLARSGMDYERTKLLAELMAPPEASGGGGGRGGGGGGGSSAGTSTGENPRLTMAQLADSWDAVPTWQDPVTNVDILASAPQNKPAGSAVQRRITKGTPQAV